MIAERLTGLSRKWRVLATLILVVTIGALDLLPGARVSLTPLYVLPVAFAGWYLSRAIALAIASGAAMLPLLGVLVPPVLPPQPLLDTVVRLVSFSILVVGAAMLRGAFDHARSDELTGIAGEPAFAYSVAAELQRARRYGRALTVAYIDIDSFKSLNEQVGRYAGDAVLRSTARALRRMLRKSDVVARVGDDEFAILFPEAGFGAAQGAIEKIRVHLPGALERGSHTLKFCIGAASFATAPETVDALLGAAQRQLREAKHKGPGSLSHELVGPLPAG
jgi:diguanylate cyclase (GGDEF)-like protein